MLISIQVSEMHGTERVKFSSCAKKNYIWASTCLKSTIKTLEQRPWTH